MDKKNSDRQDDITKSEDAGAPRIDVSQIDASQADKQPFPAAEALEYRVVVSEEAFEAVKNHARSDQQVELCGVLAGKLCKDGQGPYLAIEKAFAGAATRRTGSQVTFTHETWERIHQQMDSEAPDLSIVGWYHTHPGFGVFLSDMDQFIQDNFFNMPHQVAFVYDPVSDQRGLFIWKNGESSRLRRYWMGDKLCYDLDTEAKSAAAKPAADSHAAGQAREPARSAPPGSPWTQRPAEESRSGLYIAAIAVLVALWGGFTMGSRSGQGGDQSRLIEALIRSGIFRDGLDMRIKSVTGELDSAHSRLRKLLAEVRNPSTDSAEADPQAAAASLETQIKATQDIILAARSGLSRISEEYSQAGRLADRLGAVASLPSDVAVTKVAVVQLCAYQARQLLDDKSSAGAKERHAYAAHLRNLSVQLLPESQGEIDKLLPEFAPKQQEPPQSEQ